MGCSHSGQCVIYPVVMQRIAPYARLITFDSTEETEHHRLEFLLIAAMHQGLPNCRNVYKIIYQT